MNDSGTGSCKRKADSFAIVVDKVRRGKALDIGGGQNGKSAVSDNSPVYCFSHLGEVVFRAMAIHDLAVAYLAKTDEELLHLAENPEQLTPEAHAALTNELAN